MAPSLFTHPQHMQHGQMTTITEIMKTIKTINCPTAADKKKIAYFILVQVSYPMKFYSHHCRLCMLRKPPWTIAFTWGTLMMMTTVRNKAYYKAYPI